MRKKAEQYAIAGPIPRHASDYGILEWKQGLPLVTKIQISSMAWEEERIGLASACKPKLPRPPATYIPIQSGISSLH